MLRSRNRAMDGQLQMLAWHAATTINHNGWVKRGVSPNELLGRSRKIEIVDSPDGLAQLEGLDVGESDD